MRKFWMIGVLLISFIGVKPSFSGFVVWNVNSSAIGPFDEYCKDSEIIFSYDAAKSASNVKEVMNVSNPVSGKVYYTIEKSEHTLIAQESWTVTFPLKTSYYLGSEGLLIEFLIRNRDNILYKNEGIIYPTEKKNLYIDKDEISIYESKTAIMRIEDNVITLLRDDYNFFNKIKFFDSDLHYCLDLSAFTFLYKSGTFTCDSAYLTFEDKNKVFKYLEHINNNVCFELEPFVSEQTVNFKYKNKFYVNKVNLDCSTTFIKGFSETDQLFFPVNSKDELIGSKVELVINGCGYSKNNLIFNIEHNKHHDLIGNCINSDYCVVGEVE